MSKQRRAAPQQQPTAWNETAWSPSSSSEPTVGAGGRVAAACGWEWALSALWNPDVDKKCVVNVTDTILFGTHYTNHINGSAKRRPEFLWLTTQKNGAITRKKLKPGASADVPPIAEIQERFVEQLCLALNTSLS
uniref:Uncharacterized protein n=1 Tax=Globisporangium ultimum (strain ATCC 200006 / CBS 805.95 / DAOM BR144) TaxID=431595 RepID=K3WD26_GLOUD